MAADTQHACQHSCQQQQQSLSTGMTVPTHICSSQPNSSGKHYRSACRIYHTWLFRKVLGSHLTVGVVVHA